MTVASASLLALLLAQQPPPAQAAPQSTTATIAGTVTSVEPGRPIRKASVKLVRRSPRMTFTTTTDADGRFSFIKLTPGEYTLSASKPGFLEMTLGARRPGGSASGSPIHLAGGQTRENLSLRLPRAGVISGIVTDEFGDPAFNVPVRAVRFGYGNGTRTADSVVSAISDDLGAYRIAGLQPGEYIVSAVPRDTVAMLSAQFQSVRERQAQIVAEERAAGASRAATATMEEARREGRGPQQPSATGYVPVYYPSTTTPSLAAILRIGVSEQITGIDIQLQVSHTSIVSGVVTNSTGTPTGAPVQLIDPAMPIANIGVWFRPARADGRFAFHGVAPGSYVVRAMVSRSSGGGGGDATLSGSAAISVAGGAVEDVTLKMQPGVSVSGRLDLETLAVPVDLQRVRVDLRVIPDATDFEVPLMRATPDANGKFLMRAVPPGHYQVVVSGLPEGWTLASALFDERDAADYNLRVEGDRSITAGILKFTSRSGEISGVLSNGAGDPVNDQTIIIFPSDRDYWVARSRRIHVVQPGSDGQFVIRGLPPGEYRLTAVEFVEPGQQYDPEFLSRLVAAASAVTLDEGAKRTHDLRVR